MQYLIAFLEGIVTFISPCLLPLLPVYVSYFAGGRADTAGTLRSALGFVSGFTAVFVLLGALAGTAGSFLQQHRTALDIACGLIVIFFGLSFLGLFSLNLSGGMKRAAGRGNNGFLPSLLFGAVFSVSWTPCVGAFLGSALALAGQQGRAASGMLMLLAYSLGLGIPFILSAVLIDNLKGAFAFIKKHYGIINKISGCLLVLIGILMASGTLGRLLALLS